MRRLLALIPAVILVIGLTPAARATSPSSQTTVCHVAQGPETEYASASVKGAGTRPKLLHRITIDNPCKTWLRIGLAGTRETPGPWIVVEPGVSRMIGRAALQGAGIWEAPYSGWGMHAPSWATNPCVWSRQRNQVWVYKDGTVTRTVPSCTP